ncbi:hypothetical protein [Bradyrhizobium erythrophlei]|uniref:hypothetical protein n=1 Tax=Bradyrhizobium erythrophlei TaxID=1437360 RepID=UPI00115FB5BF|nr:hypothetical protein [Bradyrhizobium erythrophlei]
MLGEAHGSQSGPALEAAGSALGEQPPIPFGVGRFVDLTPASYDERPAIGEAAKVRRFRLVQGRNRVNSQSASPENQ